MKRLFAIALLLSAAAVQATDPMVHVYRLDNGLKLIVKEDHRAPVVVSQVWYKVGSSYEHDGITGVSHVLEHMMFKGTKKHGPGEFSRIIAENGGQENAFTSRDYTAYFQRLEKSRLPVSFELEADRMRNLRLQEDEFAKELQVVMEERRLRTEDKPESLLYERFNAVAFLNSPARIPPIGWMTDLESLRLDDLQQWYGKWYAPNNATLVVAGDVDPDAVFKLAKRFFGPLKPSEITPEKPRREVKQRGPRRETLRAPAEVAYLLLGYKVPVLLTAGDGEDWEPYALEVLAGALDGGDSARLTRELVRGQQIAASAGAGYDLYDRAETLLLLDGVPANGHTVAELEAALREQIRRLREEPVSAEELARVKAQVIASQVFEQDSVFYQAMQIGQLESIGLDWTIKDAYLERIKAISSEQVQAVARKYLIEDTLTVGVLEPLPMDAAAVAATRRAAAMGGGHGH
jgi:zinc protease